MPKIINARLDKRNFEHLVRQMHDKAIDPKPVLAAIGNLAVKSIRQNFINGGRPNAWAKSKKTNGKTMIVFPRFKKSPYKISFAKIPYFMRDGKRLSSKKSEKFNKILDLGPIFGSFGKAEMAKDFVEFAVRHTE